MTDVIKIESLADLRPGDLMFTNIGGLIPGVFPVKLGQLLIGDRVRLGPLSVDHVGVVVEASYVSGARLVQAMPRGAEEIEMTPAKHWNNHTAFVRIPEDYPGQASDAAAIARLFVTEKVPYSFLSYLSLAAWSRGIKAEWLEKLINRRRPFADGYDSHDPLRVRRPAIALPCEAICSVLADQAWSLAGKRVVDGTKPQIVTPGGLYLAAVSHRGHARGGYGLL